MTLIYKLLPRADWRAALARGVFEGSAADRADGYIHFSTADQLAETARRHFAGQRDLMVLAVEADDLGAELKWEPSRGGALFPHLHGALPCSLVRSAQAAPLAADGVPLVGEP